MKNAKRSISLLLSLLLLLGAVAVGGMTASAEATPTWDSSTGTLTIEGSGSVTGDIVETAVSDKSQIEKVVLEDGITSIDDGVFENCFALETVSLPDSLTSIGNFAFNACSILSKISIPFGVTSIGSYSFSGCSSLSDVILPPSIISIGQDSFSGCSSLNAVFACASLNLSSAGIRSEADIWRYEVLQDSYESADGKTHVKITGRDNDNGGATGLYCDAMGEGFHIDSVDAHGVVLYHVNGCPESLVKITSYNELKEFADMVNGQGLYAGNANPSASAILMNNIECKNSPDDADYATDWTPIGNYTNKYTGTFDGDGYVITGLSTPENYSGYYVGFFGYVGSGGAVQNVGLEAINITGNVYVGGVVGFNQGNVTSCYNTGSVSGESRVGGVVGDNDGPVTNCYNSGSGNISAQEFHAGGIAGSNTDEITNCYNIGSGTISSYTTGGIVGQNGGTVTNCYNSGAGNISGPTAGGVVGYNYGLVTICYNTCSGSLTGSHLGGVAGHNTGTLSNCYNSSNLEGETYVGGVVGSTQRESENSIVDNCYNTGNVTATTAYARAGGVVGENRLNCTVKNCYYNKSVCGNIGAVSGADDASNVKGLTTAQMTGANALDNMVFEFGDGEVSPWQIKANGADVSGKYYLFYPHLKGFDYDLTAASEDWPAKVEASATWSGKNSYTYNGTEQAPSVTSVIIGDCSVPADADVTYYIYKYSDEDSRWGWADISNTPTDPGNYKMVISSGDEELETKYFTILEADSDYTVKYYKNLEDGWSSESVDPVDEGEYKAVVTFTDTGYLNGQPPIEKAFVINPASVTLTANSGTENYDGTEKTVSGFTSNVEGLTFNGVTASGSGTDAGDYDVTFSGVTINETRDNTGNYVVTGTENGILKIDPASVTLTANSGTESYDGTEKTVSGFTSSVEGLTFDGVTASGSGTEPGVYDVTFSGVTENETRDTAGNYVITGTADGTLTVNPVIKFVNEDGTVLQSSAVALGETPEYKGETPAKAETDEATYTFKGWSPEITAADGNATYTATFTETKKEKPADDKPAAKAAIAIKGENALTLGYKQNKTFTADTEGVPEGGKVQWYLNGEKAGEGKTFKVENPEDDYTVQSKIVDASGSTVAESETVKVTVKHGFFDKLKAWLTDLLLGVFAPLFSKFESVC